MVSALEHVITKSLALQKELMSLLYNFHCQRWRFSEKWLLACFVIVLTKRSSHMWPNKSNLFIMYIRRLLVRLDWWVTDQYFPFTLQLYRYTLKLHIDFSVFVFLLSKSGFPPEGKTKTTFEQSSRPWSMEVNSLFIPLCRCLGYFVRLFLDITKDINAFMFNERYTYMKW